MKLVIFGCGNIANRIARSCLLVKEIELLGFASKDIEKAKRYAETYGCREYGDYDHFLNSDVDAVYIATYNPSHYELIRSCLEHHKSVICEKPMLSSVKETEELFDLARQNDVVLMEAMKSVFLPLNIKIKQLMHDGTIGKIEKVYASFMRKGNHPKDHWINEPMTGGALKDLGSYCVGTLDYLMNESPLQAFPADRIRYRIAHRTPPPPGIRPAAATPLLPPPAHSCRRRWLEPIIKQVVLTFSRCSLI